MMIPQTIDPKLIAWYKSLPDSAKDGFMADVMRQTNTILNEAKVAWPRQYVSARTGRIYEPQNDEVDIFVSDDVPRYMLLKGGEGGGKSASGIIKNLNRLRRGMNGAMCCVAADTLINGIPIAECTRPMYVRTLYGPQIASSSFCEGQADLFHVVTQSGEAVTVTKYHRFLTPTGWRQLCDLRVGDAIAVDDREHESKQKGKVPGFQDCYWWDHHQYDGYANFLGQYGQDKGLLPVLSIPDSVPGDGPLNRAYIDHFFCQSILGGDAKECQPLFFDDEVYSSLSCAFFGFLLLACLTDNQQEVAPCLIDLCEDNGDAKANGHALWQPLKQDLANIQLVRKFLRVLILGHKVPRFESDHIFSYSYYNAKYSKIANITFQYYGDFYDITVPYAGHYSAHGLWHHNSTDLEHFKKSLWPTFKEWCPWQCVIERQRYRQTEGWEPRQAFTMVFKNEVGGYSELVCGGAQESDLGGWEGPNLNFLHFDESRRHRTPAALKVFDGRIRIPGPNGEPPQLYLTTTPRKHWLYDYFGPLKDNDPLASFKADSFVATVLTSENIANLDPGFVEQRAQTLTEAERRILLLAEWEDEDDIEKFVNVIWWDNCKEDLPSLGRSEPMILALDAAKGGETNIPDCFAMIGVTRHPSRKEDVTLRYCGIWNPPPNGLLDFAPIEAELRRLCKEFSIIEVAYDPYQLHDMAMRLKREGIANFREFPQGKDRLIADKQLQDLIMSRRIAHDGNPLMRLHIDNANIKKAGQDGIRIIKRTPSLKVDAAVALSMASARSLYFNLA